MRTAASYGSVLVLGIAVAGFVHVAGCQSEPERPNVLGVHPRTTTGGTAATGGAGSVAGAAGGGTRPTGGGAAGASGVQTGGGVEPGGAGAGGASAGGVVSAGRGGAEGGTQGGRGGGTAGGDAPGGEATGGGSSVELTPIGAPCQSSAECVAGATCYEGPGTRDTTCREACPLTDAGSRGPCDEGYVCALATSARGAACLALCEPQAESCPVEDWCVPSPDPGYTGGEAVTGLCNTASGSGAGAGDPCDDGACAAGLACYVPTAGNAGPGRCEPLCDASADTAASAGCFTGEECRPITASVAVCIQPCDPFSVDACPSGEWCAPYYEGSLDGPVMEGQCSRPGPLLADAACAPGECGDGLLCASVTSPYGLGAATCQPICAPTAADCVGTARCDPVVPGLDGIGTCQLGCTPFREGTAAGCAAGEWCAPATTAELGVCTTPGSSPVGSPCSRVTDCASGAYCDCRGGVDLGCATDGGLCEPACDPAAGGGEPGACVGAATCVPKIVAGATQAFGICRATCDLDAALGCENEDETCVAGELLGAADDACVDLPTPALEPGDTCSFTDFELGDPCAPLGQCLAADALEPVTCVGICRASAGELGITGHPDCADPAMTCVEVAPELPYGVCQ